MRVLAVALGGLVVLFFVAVWLPIDPDERRPGARLSGEWGEGDVDWSFVQPRQKIYVQTSTWYLIPHSVTTVAWSADGNLYVPCGRCDTKRWPRNVAANPNVVLKIGDQLFARRAVRIDDPGERKRLLAAAMGADVPAGTAVYRMEPRT